METYELQKTSIWQFSDRGSWATHKGDYRGNWSPHVPKNLLLKYTKENEIILDPFLGSGTTMIECKLLNRNGIGIDINESALALSKKRLNFTVKNCSIQKIILGNASNLEMIQNDSIDFICTHPPYSNIIKYSKYIFGDLSLFDYDEFLVEMKKVAKEFYRVLKKRHLCSFMMGDIRKNGNVVPLGFLTLQVFQEEGFSLKEIIIKEQHNCKGTSYWNNKPVNFYLLAHEYIFVIYKK